MLLPETLKDHLRRKFIIESCRKLLGEIGLIGVPGADTFFYGFDGGEVFALFEIRGD